MKLKVLKTEQDYKQAMSRLEAIFDAKKGTSEGDELEVLSLLIEKYEEEHFPIAAPNPIEAIKFRMEQMDYDAKDLEEILGSRSRVSEILNMKRKLTLSMIRKLHNKWDIPTDVLVQAY